MTLILKKMFAPVLGGNKKDPLNDASTLHPQMSVKEEMALEEARKIVRICSSKIENPFRYGQGTLEK